MKRWSRALGTLLFALGLAADPSAAQEDAAASAGVPRLFGELLLLEPTLDDTSFVVSGATASPGSTGPIGRREHADPDFEPAFRIGAGYVFAGSDREVELSYTRLEADSSETVNGSFLWATRGSPHFGTSFEDYPGSASADVDVVYQRLDAHLSLPGQIAGVDFALQVGLEWADYRVGEDYVYVNTAAGTVGLVTAASRSWGIGPEVGLGLAYPICDACGIPGAFSLSGGASTGLLLSETNTRGSNTGAIQRLSVRDEETSRVLPAIHARVGLDYEVPVTDRVGAIFHLGYQIDSYLGGLARSSFVDDVARGQSGTDYYDFDLQGGYASLGVVF